MQFVEGMTDQPLDNPVWFSLSEAHRELALGSEPLLRYRRDVAPFVGVAPGSDDWEQRVQSLIENDEQIVLVGANNESGLKNLQLVKLSYADQMIFEGTPQPLPSSTEIVQLQAEHRPQMLALIQLVYPGYFRKDTWKMGDYFGIFQQGQLVAMAGERMSVKEYREISGVCTHPQFQGQGYAAALTNHLVHKALAHSQIPFLHVDADNTRAIALYTRLGFRKRTTLAIKRYAIPNVH